MAAGTHALTAVSRDAAGNQTIAAPVNVIVSSSLAASAVLSIQKTGNNMVMTWPSTVGQIYQVASKTNLAETTWTALSASITATGLTTSWTNAATAGANRFYVIKALN